MDVLEQIGKQFLLTMGYALLGLIAFGIAFFATVKLTPFSIRKEIEEDHNVALAVVLAALIIGIAMIVSATVHG